LKKNNPHNVALIHPFLFVVRRLVYAAILIFMFQWPFFALVTLVVITLCLMAFLFNYKQWEDSLINYQHIVNEIALYILLVLVLLFTGLT